MAAVTLKDLEILYDTKGKKRVNRSDKQGNLYLFYQDKKEKIIIRDMMENDIRPWAKAIMRARQIKPKDIKKLEEILKVEVLKRKKDDFRFWLMITNMSGKIIGTIDVSPGEGENKYSEAILEIGLRDENTINIMSDSIIRAIQNLYKNYGWYDKIYLRHITGELEELTK